MCYDLIRLEDLNSSRGIVRGVLQLHGGVVPG